nr:G-type lectin S-receptor-like serine/threonine-protein kinase SD1-29 [Ipomoea batatas]
MHPSLSDSCVPEEVLRCIHLALLCVQDLAVHRPDMSSVVLFLETDNLTLPLPRPPTYTSMRRVPETEVWNQTGDIPSFNNITISMIVEYCTAEHTLTQSQRLSVNQSLVSAGGMFELGFFSPGNSRKMYVGLWYKNVPARSILWVANRENPLVANDSASSLKIGRDGNLRLVDGEQTTVWSTNVSIHSSSNTTAVLTDIGELILKDSSTGLLLWNSFDYPTDTIIPGMNLGYDVRAGAKQELSSWESENDPSRGKFRVGISQETPPQAFTWINNSTPYWRSGPWNGWKFIGIPEQYTGYSNGMNLIQDNNLGTAYLSFNTFNRSYVSIGTIRPSGLLQINLWDDKMNAWDLNWEAPNHLCDVYGTCGPFSVCDKTKSPFCECLRGFIPKSREEWSKGNWTSGCIRQTELLCEQRRSGIAPNESKNDTFFKLTEMKLPDHFVYLYDKGMAGCREWCLENCSCVAYAFPQGIRCMVWTSSLIDVLQFSYAGEDLYLRLANSEFGDDKRKIILIVSLATVASAILLGILIYMICRRRANQKGKAQNERDIIGEELEGIHGLPSDSSELPMIGFDELAAATNDFSNDNKLGAGGFGSVYKGILANGQEVAVKRLSAHSGQGVEEFKNEILLISKLQHRNLVRLLGCSIHGEEKLLAWQLWIESREVDLIDESISSSCSFTESLRCIRIGLLCVQDHASDRPTMSNVVLMLCSETDIPRPKQPTFTIQTLLGSDSRTDRNNAQSRNEISVSVIEGR